MPCLCRLKLKLRGEHSRSLEGVDDLGFYTFEEFSAPLPSMDWDLGLLNEIEAMGSGLVCGF